MANTNPLFDDLEIAPNPTATSAADNPVMADLGIESKASAEAPEEKTPAAYDTTMGGNKRVAGLAGRAGLEGVADIADLGAKTVHAVQDIPQWASWEMLKHMRHAFGMEALPDSPLIHSPASEFTSGNPTGASVADAAADTAGLPKPETGAERVGSAAVRAVPSVLMGDPEAALPALLPTMASGAASQGAKEAGFGPLGQTVAGLSPLAPSGIAAGLRGLARGGEQGAAKLAENQATAQEAGLNLSAGQLTDKGAIRAAETLGAKVPGGGPLAATRGAGLNKQVEESVSNMVKKLAPEYNQKPPTPMSAGEHVEEAIKSRKQGLKNETTEVSNAMFEAGGGKDTPVSAPKLHAAASSVTEPTGVPEIDKLITGAKTKKFASTAEAVADKPKIPTSYSNEGLGEHVISSENGETRFVEQNNGNLKAWRSDTKALDDNGQPLQGKGEGTARLEAGAHLATSKGGALESDHSVSLAEGRAYEKLADRGWTVKKNPNATANEHSWISDKYGKPVYTVSAPKTQTIPGKAPAPGESQEFTYNPKTGESEPGQIQEPRERGTPDQTKAVLNPDTPWTLDSLKQFRTDIGQEIPRARGAQKRQLQALYGATSDDLRAHFSSKGTEAEQAWDLFNHVASQNAATQKTLTRAVKDLGGPEATFKAAMAGTKDGATKLAPVMASLNDEGKNLFRATVLHKMGRAGGAADAPFDANTFLANWKGMSPEGKNLLFGEGASAGPPTQLRKSLDALSSSLERLKDQGYIKSGFVKGVENGTGGLQKVGIFGALAYLVHSGGGAIAHVAEGHPFLAIGAATGATGLLMGNPVMSRVLTNPKTVSWLAQATKAPPAMVPVLINQLKGMGQKDPDAKDLHELIQQSGRETQEAKAPPPKKEVTPNAPYTTIYPKINRSAGMQPLPGGGYGIPPETM